MIRDNARTKKKTNDNKQTTTIQLSPCNATVQYSLMQAQSSGTIQHNNNRVSQKKSSVDRNHIQAKNQNTRNKNKQTEETSRFISRMDILKNLDNMIATHPMQSLGINVPVAVVIVIIILFLLNTTTVGTKLLLLGREAIDCALDMAEGYNEQYRIVEGEGDGGGDNNDDENKQKRQ